MTAREIAALFVDIELRLVESLKRNLNRHRKQERDEGGQNGVPEHWEAWQAAKLRDIKRYERENKQIFDAKMPEIEAETKAMLEEQHAEGGAEGFFRSSDERLDSLIDEMRGSEERVEKAALRQMNDVYRKTIRGTALGMQTGAMTLQQATDAAVKDFLAQGLNCVVYQNGRRVNIATYAEMALRTCGTRSMLLGEAKQREALGIDTVLVSQYGACSNTCLPWQGLVYIDDVWQDYHGEHTPGGTYGVSRNGRQYPLLSVAIRGGLFHPNCRHTISTWVEGVSTRPPMMDKGQIERVSKWEARQRELERRVRKAKREAAGLSEPEAVKAAKAKVRAAQKNLREFVDQHGDVLRRDYWREREDALQGSAPDHLTPATADGTMKPENKRYSENAVVEMSKNADAIDTKHTDIPSKWSGKTLVEDPEKMPGALGQKRWSCDIALRADADAGVAIHEHLHARSVSYYDEKCYKENKKIEEGSVELFAQEICKAESIPHKPTYGKFVVSLRTINKVAHFSENDYDFAKTLFEIPLPQRFKWLRESVTTFLGNDRVLNKEEQIALDALTDILWGG